MNFQSLANFLDFSEFINSFSFSGISFNASCLRQADVGGGSDVWGQHVSDSN